MAAWRAARNPPPILTAADLDARRPVWEALSDLFLDTDITLSRDWRVRVLAASPYTLAELDAILRSEIYPVCIHNLFSIAGEWAGFDVQTLEHAILKQKTARFGWPHALTIHLGMALIRADWHTDKQAIITARSTR